MGDPAAYEGLAHLHPLGRVGDVVDAIVYLEQATFVTGEILARRRRSGRWTLTRLERSRSISDGCMPVAQSWGRHPGPQHTTKSGLGWDAHGR
jgi:hypothetical protein